MEPETQANIKSLPITSKDLLCLLQTSTPAETRRAIAKQLNSIKIKLHPQLKELFRKVILSRSKSLNELFEQFESLNACFKDVQVSSLVVQIYYDIIKQIVKERDPDGTLYRKAYVRIWQSMPMCCLNDYITTFGLQSEIVHNDWENIEKMIKSHLMNGKLKDAAFYYTIFKRQDAKFEKQFFLPKLIKGEDLYTEPVITMLKAAPELLQAFAEIANPDVAIKVLTMAKADISTHPRLIEHMQRQNYLHHVHEFKDWFKMEERFSYCRKFLEWYAHDHLEGDIRQSVLARIGAIDEQELVPNPLYSQDKFATTEEVLGKQSEGLWKLSEFGICEDDVVFIDDHTKEEFTQAKQNLLSAQVVGFDSEYRATTHKFEDDGVSIIQLSAGKKIFLFDSLALQKSQEFASLIRDLFYSPKVTKVGHSIKNDYTEMNKTFSFNKQKCQSFVDISELFKQKFPTAIQSSLAFIAQSLTGKFLSKYEQRSNWNRRPLRKAQKHYAAMDAFICEILYDKLTNSNVEINEQNGTEKKEKKLELGMHYEQNFSYGKENQHFIKKPKFMVDNMLKKLAGYLRNLGLDAEYLEVKDHTLALSVAQKEERIILTKDKHLRSKKNARVPIFYIESNDSEQMTKQVVAFFKIDMEKLHLLSRCVKCNSGDLVLMDYKKAIESLSFQYEDVNIKEFWQCAKCNQIYWEGQSYKNSKKRFADFKKKK